MIIIDPTEIRYVAPYLTQSTPWAALPIEDATGADIVLSTWAAPANTPTLAWEHVKRGTGYQLKRGMDLPASVFDGRLMRQLTRMLEYWEIPWAVHVAEVSRAIDSETVINNEVQHGRLYPFKSYVSTIRNWQRAGGGWLTIPESHFEQWMKDELRRLKRDRPERLIRHASVRLLPLSKEEEALVALGAKPMMAHQLWETLGDNASLIRAIAMLVDGTAAELPGIGKGTCRKVAKFLGLRNGERLAALPVVEVEGVQQAQVVMEQVFGYQVERDNQEMT